MLEQGKVAREEMESSAIPYLHFPELPGASWTCTTSSLHQAESHLPRAPSRSSHSWLLNTPLKSGQPKFAVISLGKVLIIII